MILLVAGLLIVLLVWAVRVSIRKVRWRFRARADARTRSAACSMAADDAGDGHKPAHC